MRSIHAAVVAGVLITACGSSHRVGDVPDGAVRAGDSSVSTGPLAERVCDRLDRSYCAANQTCCTDPTMRYESEAACIADRAADDDCRGLLRGAAFTDGRVLVDETLLEQFLMQVEADNSACIAVGHSPIGVFNGTLPAGGDCSPTLADPSPAFACRPELFCHLSDLSGGVGTGTCVARAGAGEPCQAHELGDQCEDGLYCARPSFDVADGTCAARKPAGALCMASQECQSPLVCDDGQCATLARTPDPSYYCTGGGTGTTCEMGSGSAGPDGCSHGWSACSDGATYNVTCTGATGAPLMCTCEKDGVVAGSFTSTTFCSGDEAARAAANAGCGWSI